MRQPTKRNANDGYQFTHIGGNVNNFLMAQTAYAQSMETIAEVDTVIDSAIHHTILTQLGMKAGTCTFGEVGVKSILKEMKQFHDREVVKPLKSSEVVNKIKRKALGYLMFLK